MSSSHIGWNAANGWVAWCYGCRCERWLVLSVGGGPFNAHMAYCQACGRYRCPPARPNDAGRDAPYTSKPDGLAVAPLEGKTPAIEAGNRT